MTIPEPAAATLAPPTDAASPDNPSTDTRRLKIVESALAAFSRKGFYDSRVDDICSVARISRATFYRYFEGKDDIFDALLDLMSHEVLASAEHLGAVTPDGPGRETITNWIRDLVAITERWGTVVDEVVRPRENQSDARSRAVLLTARFADILATRLTEGGVEGVDPMMAALAIIAMTERMAHQVRTWNVEIERRTLVDTLATMSMKMLHPTMVISR
jgi:AcrR family transcriptional regulator